MQRRPLSVENLHVAPANAELPPRPWRPDIHTAETRQRCLDGGHIAGPDLDHRAKLFSKQHADRFSRFARGQLQFQPASSSKGHLQQAGQQPAIRAIVVGEQASFPVEALNGLKEENKLFRGIQIRRLAPRLAIALSERAAAQTVSAVAQVNQQQAGVPCVQAKLRRQRASGVRHRSERGNDQGQRRGYFFVIPPGAHGKAVFAHGNGNAQRRAQLHADGTHRVEQRLLLGFVAGGGHPVG